MKVNLSLLVIFAGGSTVSSENNEGLVDIKTLSALKEFQSRLGGKVYFGSAAPIKAANPHVTIAQVPSYDDNVILLNSQIDRELIRRIKPDMVLISVTDPGARELSEYSGKIILIDDYSAKVRLDVQLVGVDNLLQCGRITAGHYRRILKNRKKLAAAAGIQCNGYASYEYYKKQHPKTHLFFDHRVTSHQLSVSEATPKPVSHKLRLGFSGRLQELKGVLLFKPLLEELDNRGIDYSFDIMGDGIERKRLEEELGHRAKFHGFMEYGTEWLPFVRENIDLMVLPHIQGDSSSTYFESLGAGVPVVGFENDSLSPLVQFSDAAIAVQMKNIDALAQSIEELSQNPEKIAKMREKAFIYMRDKSYEKIMDARVEHLLSL